MNSPHCYLFRAYHNLPVISERDGLDYYHPQRRQARWDLKAVEHQLDLFSHSRNHLLAAHYDGPQESLGDEYNPPFGWHCGRRTARRL